MLGISGCSFLGLIQETSGEKTSIEQACDWNLCGYKERFPFPACLWWSMCATFICELIINIYLFVISSHKPRGWEGNFCTTKVKIHLSVLPSFPKDVSLLSLTIPNNPNLHLPHLGKNMLNINILTILCILHHLNCGIHALWLSLSNKTFSNVYFKSSQNQNYFQ